MSFHKFFYLPLYHLINNTKKIKILWEVHVIFTWLHTLMLISKRVRLKIFGNWFCQIFMIKCINYFGHFSKISNKFPILIAYFITHPIYKMILIFLIYVGLDDVRNFKFFFFVNLDWWRRCWQPSWDIRFFIRFKQVNMKQWMHFHRWW